MTVTQYTAHWKRKLELAAWLLMNLLVNILGGLADLDPLFDLNLLQVWFATNMARNVTVLQMNE